MKRYFLSFLWLVVSFLSTCPVYAHMDKPIELKGTTLTGLPQRYAPAELDLKASRFRIGKHEMTFAPYLKTIFEQPYDVRVFASWNHDPAFMPFYIYLRVQPKNRDYSYRILFNVETLELMELSVVLELADSQTWQLTIELRENIKQQIRDSIRTIE